MERMMSKREQTEPQPAHAPKDDSPESQKRKLDRSSDHEALLSEDAPGWQRIEDLPTEPHHALPTYPDMDWDGPTIPDGKVLESWDIDERG